MFFLNHLRECIDVFNGGKNWSTRRNYIYKKFQALYNLIFRYSPVLLFTSVMMTKTDSTVQNWHHLKAF
jgi:hypothetical protein